MRDPAELISRYFDAQLADGELDQLRGWIAADPQNLRQFVRESLLHSRLHDILQQDDVRGLVFDDAAGESDVIDPQHILSLLDEDERAALRRAQEEADRARIEAEARARREQWEELFNRKPAADAPAVPRAFAYLGAAAAAAILLLAGRLLAPAPAPPKAAPRAPLANAAPAAPQAVARIVSSLHARWQDDRRSTDPGTSLLPGPAVLEQGVVEVELAAGARLVVEAPAALELLTADRARLLGGRVVATVPAQALGFTLLSPAASFVDLGTEFGVEVDAAGASSVHVLDGEVALVPSRKDSGPSRTLRQGSASTVSGDGATVADIAFDQSRFIRRVPASAYEFAVLQSRPLGYWRLDEPGGAVVEDAGRLHANGSLGAGVALAAGAPGGPARAASFEPEHKGVELGGLAELSRVDNLTCEAWVWAGDAPSGPRRVLSNFDRMPRRGFGFGVVDAPWYQLPEEGLFLHLTAYGAYDCVSKSPAPAGQWVHLAATIDAAGEPRLYVNGEEVDVRFRPIGAGGYVDDAAADGAGVWGEERPPTAAAAAPSTGPARIGRNPDGTDGQCHPERWLGQLGHVAVYDRALDPEEIKRHYDAARPVN
jgi:hypothetical protein